MEAPITYLQFPQHYATANTMIYFPMLRNDSDGSIDLGLFDSFALPELKVICLQFSVF
jgi:hypothetical protein